MLGQGRPAKRPSIDRVRELTKAEVEGTPRGKAPSVKRFRDTHHMVARLFAMGLRPGEVAFRTGYSQTRIGILHSDPAFEELVASYRADVNESFREQTDEYFENISAIRNATARLARDKLEAIEDPDDISFRELALFHDTTADRTGYPKRTVAVNVNVDFAAQLDKAIKRSEAARSFDEEPKAIEHAKVRRI